MAKNRVIGAKGKIPWHLPNELQLFKQVTMGHHIIMGRKTHESIGRLLPGRTTVIVTRQSDYAVPGAKIAHTLEQAVALCTGDSEIFIIGGGELYRASIADRRPPVPDGGRCRTRRRHADAGLQSRRLAAAKHKAVFQGRAPRPRLPLRGA